MFKHVFTVYSQNFLTSHCPLDNPPWADYKDHQITAIRLDLTDEALLGRGDVEVVNNSEEIKRVFEEHTEFLAELVLNVKELSVFIRRKDGGATSAFEISFALELFLGLYDSGVYKIVEYGRTVDTNQIVYRIKNSDDQWLTGFDPDTGIPHFNRPTYDPRGYLDRTLAEKVAIRCMVNHD